LDFAVGRTVRHQLTLAAYFQPDDIAGCTVSRTRCSPRARPSTLHPLFHQVRYLLTAQWLQVNHAAGLQTSAQSLPGVISGVASIVGNAGGGWIMQTYGSNVLYRTTSVMVLCSAALFACFSAYRNSKLAQSANEDTSRHT
jgi:hypothetical protein